MMNRKIALFFIFALILSLLLVGNGSLQGQPLAGSDSFPGHFYVMTDTSLEKLSSGGERETIINVGANAFGGYFELFNDEIYVTYNNQVRAYALDGQTFRNIPLTAGLNGTLVMLPDGRMALLNNDDDVVHFTDPDGQWLATTAIRDNPDANNQNLNGIVVGNRLILSEDGDKNIIQIDLDSYQSSIFKNMAAIPSWIGAIAYANGYYYVCNYNTVYRFTETSGPTAVGQLPPGESNIIGLKVIGNTAYVTVNHAGKLYAIDLNSGEATPIVADLDYPQDLEFHSQTVYLPIAMR